MQATEFKPGDKVSMLTNIRRLRGFVEHSAPDHVRVRWEDDCIGMLVFEWQIGRLELGWPDEG